MATLLAVFAFLAFAPGDAPEMEARTWTDKSGKFKVTAKMVEYADGKVQLETEDGRVIAIPLERLAAPDQAYIQGVLKTRREAKAQATREERTTKVAAAGGGATWPSWRGANRDGKSTETGLLKEWPQGGPPLLYSQKGIGNGFSSVAVANGTIYTIGKINGAESVVALSEKDGSPLWATPFGRGEPNGTPTVDGNLVFAVGHDGDMICCDAKTGREMWRKNFANDFGGKMHSGWGFSESPLVDGDKVIVTPGGKNAILAALNKKTGAVIWTTDMKDIGNRGGDGAAYSSVVISNGAGVKQYVQLVGRGVIGVDAATGKMLWGYNNIANGTANIPTPIVKDDYIFCSTGYGTGAALLKLSKDGDGVKADEEYFLEANKMQNHHGGMILIDDCIYHGNAHNEGFPMCIDMKSGEKKWAPGRGPGTGSAAITYADGNLIFRYQNGVVALIEANPETFVLKGSFTPPTVHREAWAHPVVANGRLYLRDQNDLHVYNVKGKK